VFAPTSDNFSKLVFEHWGVGGIFFLLIPPLCSIISILVYAEEIMYIFRKSNSKDLRNSLLWLLGVLPTVITVSTIGVFIPRSLVYITFMNNIYFAYANYKYYYLIMVFAGGQKPFVDKSSHQEIKTNLVPCCCLCCLPKIYNSVKATEMAKWFIFQAVIVVPAVGAISMILKSDSKLYSYTDVSASTYLSVIGAVSSLFSIYGFKMIATFTKQIHGMETTHLIKGKTVCMQLVMFIIGLEGIFFNVLSQLGLFPCVEPFNFNSNRKAINNYAVIIQCFLLVYPMRKYYRRQKDIERQAVLTDDISLGNNSDFYNIRSNDPQVERVSEPNYGTGNKDILSLHNSNYDGGQSES